MQERIVRVIKRIAITANLFLCWIASSIYYYGVYPVMIEKLGRNLGFVCFFITTLTISLILVLLYDLLGKDVLGIESFLRKWREGDIWIIRFLKSANAILKRYVLVLTPIKSTIELFKPRCKNLGMVVRVGAYVATFYGLTMVQSPPFTVIFMRKSKKTLDINGWTILVLSCLLSSTIFLIVNKGIREIWERM